MQFCSRTTRISFVHNICIVVAELLKFSRLVNNTGSRLRRSHPGLDTELIQKSVDLLSPAFPIPVRARGTQLVSKTIDVYAETHIKENTTS